MAASKLATVVNTAPSLLSGASALTSTTAPRMQNSFHHPSWLSSSSSKIVQIAFRTMVHKAYGKPAPIVAERERIAALSYWERKEALKEKRREWFRAHQERQERLKTRRAGRNRFVHRRAFRQWFLPKKIEEEFHHRKAKQAGLDWHYRIASVVQRNNRVQADKLDFEIAYENLKEQLGVWGKVYPEEFAGKQKIEDVKPMTDEELIAMLPFTPAPRETEADHTGDVRTFQRQLKTQIYLTVQNKETGLWQFPTVDLKYEEGETCFEAAKRCMLERVGPSCQVYVISGCPWSVDVQAYPEEEQQALGVYGRKTFFMLIYHDDGEVDLSELQEQDYAWLTRSEMMERINKQHEGDERTSKLYHYMLQQM